MKNQYVRGEVVEEHVPEHKELDPKDLEDVAAGHNDGSTHTGF